MAEGRGVKSMSTLTEVQAKSAPIISRIGNEAVRFGALKLVERCYNRGIDIRITQGLRTIEEQNALYAQGRTVPGPIVTNARGGQSYHNFSLAIDFVLIKGGYDMKYDGDSDGIADWVEVVSEAKVLGFSWGGDWKSFKDYPHFEMTFGLPLADLRDGKRPSDKQIAVALSKLNELEKMEDEKMSAELEKKFEEFKKATEAQFKTQDEKIKLLEKRHAMPAWADKLLYDMKQKHLITSANDKGYDFSTIAQMMKNAGMLEKTFLNHIAQVNKGLLKDESE